MPAVVTDAELVERHLAGDRRALAEIHERYSTRIHDLCRAMLGSPEDAADAYQDTFLVAARRLDGLRDRERLRAWLYAVARNQCRARLRARRRVRPVEDAGADVAVEVDMTTGVARGELARLVDEAAAGLDERDREVLDLHMRHGLEGEELADVLGVSVQNAYKLVQRVRARVERSLGALLVARHARRDCETLSRLLADWDGRLSPLWRKRIARHVDDCDVCRRHRAALLDPGGLASAMPLSAPSSALHARVGSLLGAVPPPPPGHRPARWRRDGFPADSGRRLSPWWPAALGVLALVGLFGGVAASGAFGGSSGGTSVATPVVTSTTVTSTTASTTTTTAPPTTTTTSAPSSSTTVTSTTASTTTTTAPPTTTTTSAPSSSTTVTSTTTSTTTTTAPPTTTPDTRPPEIRAVDVSPGAVVETDPACAKDPLVAVITVDAVDDRGIVELTARWTLGGWPHQVVLTSSGTTTWTATLGPFDPGTVGPNGEAATITVTAIDGSGWQTRSVQPRLLIVYPCR